MTTTETQQNTSLTDVKPQRDILYPQLFKHPNLKNTVRMVLTNGDVIGEYTLNDGYEIVVISISVRKVV